MSRLGVTGLCVNALKFRLVRSRDLGFRTLFFGMQVAGCMLGSRAEGACIVLSSFP